MTPDSVFGSAPTVSGMTCSRSVSIAAVDAWSVPVPSIGMVMFATVASLLTSIVIGSCIRPLASALLLEPMDRLLHGRRVDVRSLHDDVGGKRRAGEGLLHACL